MRSRALPSNDAALVALLLAANPEDLGGVTLAGMPAPERDDWIEAFRKLLPEPSPWLKIPVNVSDDRLLGGLDFAATVASKRPIFATGLLEAADGGVLVLSMAERIRDSAASIIGSTLERGELLVERDGVRRLCNTQFCVLALDEGIGQDERIAQSLSERLAFRLQLADLGPSEAELRSWSASDVAAARRRLRTVSIREELLVQFCQSASAFGLGSMRGDLFMLAAARTAAALAGAESVSDEHAAMAARLVLPHRATRTPAEAPPPQERDEQEDESHEQRSGEQQIPDDVIVDAVLAALPPDLLDKLSQSMRPSRQKDGGGRRGPRAKSRLRGRPIGIEPSAQLGGARLNILATLKSAAPWQSIRKRDRDAGVLELRPSDIQVTRFQDRIETTTIFVVDASGSQAAQRLAEVKGAIELLLQDCYVRRDQVALIAFRRSDAEVLLEPTRALARVKRSLAALPGGGGTPLATGIDTARQMADSIARQGRIPAIVLLTDGRANVARDATPGAAKAEEEAQSAARLLRASGVRSILVDTSRRPKPRAQKLADAMGAGYVPLPNANAEKISGAVQRNLAS